MNTMCAAGFNGIVVSGWVDGAKMMNARLTDGESMLAKLVDGAEHVRPLFYSHS